MLAIMALVERHLTQIREGDGSRKSAILICDEQFVLRRAAQAVPYRIAVGFGVDHDVIISHQVMDLKASQGGHIMTRLQIETAPLELVCEEGMAVQDLGHHRRCHDADHHADRQLVVAGKLKDDENGGNRGSQYRPRNRPHADQRVGPISRVQFRERNMREISERAANHRANEKAW